MEQYWGPVLQQRRPVVLCVNPAVVFKLTVPAMRRVFPNLELDDPKTYKLSLPPEAEISGHDINGIHDQFVFSGATQAVNRLTQLFASRGLSTRVASANEFSTRSFQENPAVLIGSYSNRFTIDLTRDFRFFFPRDPARVRIQDQRNPTRTWELRRRHGGQTVETDFAIVFRALRHRDINRPLFGISGITHYATQAATELLTSEEGFQRFASALPDGWQSRNIEAVLETHVVAGAPTEPRVVAVHVW